MSNEELNQDILSSVKAIIASNTVYMLSSMLLSGLEENDFRELPIEPGPLTYPRQLENLYIELDSEIYRLPLRAAVVDAIVKWMPEGHTLETLSNLTSMVSLLRVTEAIPALEDLIQAMKGDDHEKAFSVVAKIIDTMGGLGGERAYLFLRGLYHDSKCNVGHLGQLFMALSYLEPQLYWEHLPQFLMLVRDYPELYDPPRARLASLIRLVSLPALTSGWAKLSSTDLRIFIRMLNREEWSPLIIRTFGTLGPSGIRVRRRVLDNLQSPPQTWYDAEPDLPAHTANQVKSLVAQDRVEPLMSLSVQDMLRTLRDSS